MSGRGEKLIEPWEEMMLELSGDGETWQVKGNTIKINETLGHWIN